MLRTCPKCKQELELNKDNFGVSSFNRNGFGTYCKSCKRNENKRYYSNKKEYVSRNRDKVKLTKIKWREKNPDYDRNHYRANKYPAYLRTRKHTLKKFYNLTLEDFDLLRQRQNFRCAMCKIEEYQLNGRTLQVDHDHSCCLGKISCGKCIRGLLCGSCNKLLGIAKDKKDILIRAIRYLTKPSPKE